MNDLEKLFNGVSDDFFKHVIKYIDFPPEDLEPSNESREEGFNANFPNLAPPLTAVLANLPSGFRGGFHTDAPERKPSISLNQQASDSANEASFSRSIPLSNQSANVEDSKTSRSHPSSQALERSSSCLNRNPIPSSSFPVEEKHAESNKDTPISRESNSLDASGQESGGYFLRKLQGMKRQEPNLMFLSADGVTKRPQKLAGGRKCSHCKVTKTPQWREGPMGPKTLCNACGVRYRSGRLLPEYRPAASPVFDTTLHSNVHATVMMLRKKPKQQGNPVPSCNELNFPVKKHADSNRPISASNDSNSLDTSETESLPGYCAAGSYTFDPSLCSNVHQNATALQESSDASKSYV